MKERDDRARRFQDLLVWQKSHALVLQTYRMTSCFPSEERFGLMSQMRRSAVSVPANIAEGFRRRTVADKRRLMNIAQGSLEELRYYFILTHDLAFAETNNESVAAEEVAKMLSSYVSKF